MKPIRIFTASEQVAKHLREGIQKGVWKGLMPGSQRLARGLRVGQDTIVGALTILEKEGVLQPQGVGKRRRIVLSDEMERPLIRVRILLYDQIDRLNPVEGELITRLQGLGYSADFELKSLQDLGMRVDRIARYVEERPSDAWIVVAGSKDVLKWFSEQDVPAMAMFGRFIGLPIASSAPWNSPALRRIIDRLIELGHQRIVMIAREERRKPKPAVFEQHFLEMLAESGLMVGAYNLPDWEESSAGLERCLNSLFLHTPPTAIIVQEPAIFSSVRQHLSDRGVVAPRDVSLICDEGDPGFAWLNPAVSHITWKQKAVVDRAIQWVGNVAKGKEDRRQVPVEASFCEGGTIGPAS